MGGAGSRASGENYLGAIVTLFLGSAFGYAIYTFTLLPLFGGEVGALNYLFWLEFAFGLVSGGLQSVLAGVAALGVSYLRAERDRVRIWDGPEPQ